MQCRDKGIVNEPWIQCNMYVHMYPLITFVTIFQLKFIIQINFWQNIGPIFFILRQHSPYCCARSHEIFIVPMISYTRYSMNNVAQSPPCLKYLKTWKTWGESASAINWKVFYFSAINIWGVSWRYRQAYRCSCKGSFIFVMF